MMAASAGSRMVCKVRFFDLRLRDVGIKFGSRNVGMSEEHLHCSQVGTVLQHVCRATVAKHVRTGLALRVLVNYLPDPHSCKLLSSRSDEKPW